MAKDFADISRLELAQDRNEAKRDAVSKMVKVWESKNAKRALQGAGLSTMAVTLAACGGSSTTSTTPTTPTTPVTPAPVGQQFALTTGVDIVAGTAGDDVFIGDMAASVASVQAADQISGGLGADTLKAYVIDAFTLPELTSIENVYVKATTLMSIDVTGETEVSSLEVDGAATATGSASNKTLTISADQILTLDSIVDGSAAADSAGSGQIILATGSATSTSLVFDGVGGKATAADLDIIIDTDLTTLNLTAVGKNYVDLIDGAGSADSDAVKTLNISGSGSVDLANANFAAATVVNAAQNSGGVEVKVSSSLAKTVTGGSGNDRFITDNNITNLDTYNGGDGEDTLQVASGSLNSSTSDLGKGINKITNFEVLATTEDGALTISSTAITSVSKFEVTTGVTAASAGAEKDAVTLTFDSGDTLIIRGSVVGGVGSGDSAAADAAGDAIILTPSVDGSSDTLNLVINAGAAVSITGGDGSASTDDANSGTGINAGTVELLTIHTTAATDDLTVAAGGIAASATAGKDVSIGANGKIVLTGAGDVNLGTVYANAGAAADDLTIDGSAMTGVLTVKTGDGNDTINGGSKADFITAGAGANVITTGAGADTIYVLAADAPTTSAMSTITDFTAGLGGDVLSLDNSGADSSSYVKLTTSQLADAAASSTIGAAITVALNAIAADKWTAFEFADKTYALFSGDTGTTYDTSDFIVFLQGVEVADLSQANFAVV